MMLYLMVSQLRENAEENNKANTDQANS